MTGNVSLRFESHWTFSTLIKSLQMTNLLYRTILKNFNITAYAIGHTAEKVQSTQMNYCDYRARSISNLISYQVQVAHLQVSP